MTEAAYLAGLLEWEGGEEYKEPFTHERKQGVTQPGRDPRLERGSRRFKSFLPDQFKTCHLI